MPISEQAGNVATGIVDGLKTQPLALALIVLNLLFVGVGAYVWKSESARRAEFVGSIMQKCLDITAKPDGFK